MATRIAQSRALVNRCEKAGMRVERAADGWKVWGADNRPHIIHQSYSDGIWSLKLITKEIEEDGLLDAEEAVKQQKQEQRKLAIRNQKAEEEKAMAAAQKRANAQKTMVAKASGPYLTEPEDVPYEWFATPHPAPWVRLVWMTPALAKRILDNLNTDNRPLGDQTTEHYKNVMLSDQWLLTHQGAAMDIRGVLQDAQHRLYAIVEAGKIDCDIRVPMFFTVGMPVENFKAIDENRLRTAAQLFGKDGEKNRSTLQSMIRLILAYKDPSQDVRRAYRIRRTNGQVLDTFAGDADLMRDCAARAQSAARKVKCTPVIYATAMYLIRHAHKPGNRYVDLFFHGIDTGEVEGHSRIKLEADDPRRVLREEFERIKDGGKKTQRTALDKVAMILIAWNNIILERHPRRILFGIDATPPQVLICDDANGVPPRALRDEVEAADLPPVFEFFA